MNTMHSASSLQSNHPESTCSVCDEALTAIVDFDSLPCTFCDDPVPVSMACASNHALCGTCEELPAIDVIFQHCMRTRETDPLRIADLLMQHPSVRLTGADHHFLVPAVLFAAYSNVFDEHQEREQRLREARILSECVHDGQCGSGHACGAATGSGIFFDVLTKTSEYSEHYRQWSSRAEARTMERIERDVRMRCCKLDTSLAIEEAARFLAETHGLHLPVYTRSICGVSKLHRDCLATACPFSNHSIHPAKNRPS